jgi:hypothetical protein
MEVQHPHTQSAPPSTLGSSLPFSPSPPFTQFVLRHSRPCPVQNQSTVQGPFCVFDSPSSLLHRVPNLTALSLAFAVLSACPACLPIWSHSINRHRLLLPPRLSSSSFSTYLPQASVYLGPGPHYSQIIRSNFAPPFTRARCIRFACLGTRPTLAFLLLLQNASTPYLAVHSTFYQQPFLGELEFSIFSNNLLLSSIRQITQRRTAPSATLGFKLLHS